MRFSPPTRARAAARTAKDRRTRTAAPAPRAGTLERQADDAAARAMRPSERAAARALTRAPAARAPTPNSRGAPLPRATRALLEQRFGADLGAVRIHTDAPAGEAAVDAGALAFAAGRDVYFAPGAFSPDMPSGVTLIAHEIAHVLQQTGRADDRGVVHATAHEGDGALQLAKKFPAVTTRTARPTLDDSLGNNAILGLRIKEYEALFPGDADLALAIDWFLDQLFTLDGGVYRLSISSGGSTSALDALADSIKQDVDGGTASARSFVVEILAMTDGSVEPWWEAAATVLERDTKFGILTRMSALSQPFAIWLKKKRDAWFAPALGHPRLKPWFDDLFAAYAEPLLDPRVNKTRELKGKDPVDGVVREWPAQRAAIIAKGTSGYVLNERAVWAMNLLGEANQERADAQGEWAAKIKAEADSKKQQAKMFDALAVRAFAAGLMKEHFDAAKWSNKPRLFRDLAERLRKLAATVETFYTRALADLERFNQLFTVRPGLLLTDAAVTKFAGGLDRTPELTDLETLLVTHGDQLFANPGDAPPPSLDYVTKLAGLKVDLVALQNKVLGNLVATLVAKPDVVPSPTIGWVLAWVRAAILFLDKNPLDLAADLKDKALVPSTGATVQAEDLRRAHRFGMARVFLECALFAGFEGVRKTAAALMVGDGKSRIVIIEDWKEDPDPAGRIFVDFNGQENRPPLTLVSNTERLAAAAEGRDAKEVRAPFTLAQLVNFFNLEYLQTVTRGLEGVLDAAYKNPITNKTTFSLKPVNDAAKAQPKPRRWTPKRSLWLLNDADPKSVRQLLLESGKTQYQLKVAPLGAVIYPRYRAQAASSAFVWVIPDLTPMVTFLRANVPLLDQMITDAGMTPAGESDPEHWIYQLGTLFASGKADHDKIWRAIKNILATTFWDEQKRLLKFSREIAALDRQLLKFKIVDLLDQWKGRPRGGMGGVKNTYADRALQLIRDYHARVEPYGDAGTQTAALVLDLGPKLDDVFTRGDEIPGELYPLLVMGINAVDIQQAGRKGQKNPNGEPVVLLGDVIGRGGESVSSLSAGKPYLEKVKVRIETYLKSMQEKTGFYAEDNQFKTYRYGSTFKLREEFSWDNRDYKIKKIHRTFAYHPAIGAVPSVLKEGNAKDAPEIPRDQAIPLFTIDIDDSEAPLGAPTPQVWNLSGPSAEGIPEERAKRRKLAPLAATATEEDREERSVLEEKIKEEVETEQETGRYIVTSADDKLLNLIAFAVELAAMNKGLQRTGQVIGGFMEVVVTAAELILPGGQVVAWAEMAAGAVQVVTDPEMIELIDTLREDPSRIIDLIKEKLSTIATPEGVWSILFDDGGGVLDKFAEFATIFDVARSKRKRSPQTNRRAKPRGRLGRIVMFIVNLGKRFLRAFRMLKLMFKRPLAAIRSAIVTRPKLAWLLTKALEIFDKVKRYADVAVMMGSELLDTALDAKTHVTEFVKSITDMELPGELVPLDQIYGYLLSFILGKIPKVRLIKPILDAIGWTDKLAGIIIDYIGVKDSWADPNKYWRDYLVPFLEPYFKDLKRGLVDGVLGLVNAIGREMDPDFKLDLPGDDELGDNKPKLVTAEELEEYPSDEPPLPATISIPRGGGHPLDGGALGAAQAHFGQDFGHVRVHDDAAASLFTSTLGAEAATSGSHVYLGPSAGTDVLHHELAHVVQQTGSRPIGGDYASTPVRGDSGRGITFDPAREAAADAMASSGNAAGAGGADSSLGVQPKLGEQILKKVITSLATFRPGGGQFKAPAASASDVPGASRAHKVWTDLKAMLSTKKAKFAKFLSEEKLVKPTIIDRITSPIANSDVLGVAALAQRKVAGKKTPDGEPVTELHPSRFVTLLEGFLYARTGVALQIDASHKAGSTTVEGVNVTYLHLPYLPYQGHGKDLWDLIMSNTSLVKPSEKADVDRIRHLLRARLDALPPEPWLWDSSKFDLSSRFIRSFREFYEASKGRGRPTSIPVAKVYANPSLPGDHSGLRVATHGELTKGDTKKDHPERADRESHHLPQFLLAEFFRNKNKNAKAWPEKKLSSYGPRIGIAPGTTYINSVTPDGKKFDLVGLDPTDSGRGDNLPAVLLAAETHQKGPLHLDDYRDEKDDKLAQSTLIKAHWWMSLPGSLRNSDGKQWDDYIRTDKSAGVQIAKAMKEVYRWVKDDIMIPGLKTALVKFEKPYYEGLAAELGHIDSKDKVLAAYELDGTLLGKVVTAVERKNKEVMTGGWA